MALEREALTERKSKRAIDVHSSVTARTELEFLVDLSAQ